MDNLFIMGSSHTKAEQSVRTTLLTLNELSWQINEEKSSLNPSQCTKFLSLLVNMTTTPLFKVPTVKIWAVQQDVDCLLLLHNKTSHIPVHKLVAVTGLCISLSKAVLPGPLMLRNVFCVIMSHSSWKADISLPPKATSNLINWRNRMNHWRGQTALWPPADITIDTDTSQHGWGMISLCVTLMLASWW
jgi:hypothetical protein